MKKKYQWGSRSLKKLCESEFFQPVLFKLSITQCCSKSNVMLVCNLMYYIKKAPHTNGIFRRKKTQLLHESHLHEDCLYKKKMKNCYVISCVSVHIHAPQLHTHTHPLSTFALSLRRLKSFIKKFIHIFFSSPLSTSLSPPVTPTSICCCQSVYLMPRVCCQRSVGIF